METTVDSSVLMPTLVESNHDRPKTKPYLLRSIRTSIAEATEGKRISVAGVHVSANELANFSFLLPIILYAAAANLSSSNQTKSRKIAFTFDLEADAHAVLGLKVSYITVSSAVALKSAIADVLQKAVIDNEFILENCLQQFGELISEHLGPEWEPACPDGKTFSVEI